MANNHTAVKVDIEQRKIIIKLNGGTVDSVDIDILWRLGPYEFPVMQSLTNVTPNNAVSKALTELVEKLHVMLYTVLLNQRQQIADNQPPIADPKTADS